MSPPPIGSTNIAPRISAAANRPHSAIVLPPANTTNTPSANSEKRISALTSTLQRKLERLARQDLLQLSEGDNASGERDRADGGAEHDRRCFADSDGVARTRKTQINSATDTSAAVAPPIPLNSATICGIAVICTVLAK